MTAAELSGPITVGRLLAPASPVAVDLEGAGYVEEEFVASGISTSFRAPLGLGADGRWSVVPDERAEYRTRLVVRRPATEPGFNGTVVVEWLNVSGGIEACPDWSYVGEEIVRQGYGYVAVSAQALGVDGGAGLVDTGFPGSGLRHRSPERYGALHHPGDRFSFDLYGQVAAALLDGHGGGALGPLRPEIVLGVGESQSAMFLTSYVNALSRVHGVFDGFFVHSRGGGAASLTGVPTGDDAPRVVHIRDDLEVPVFVFETETDLGERLGYGRARQPDTDRFRAWEVAGTAHGDAFLVGSMAHLLGCEGRINDGPHHVVAMAALRALRRWVVDGTPPPEAAPLLLASQDPPVLSRDALGNARGGVRTPDVDAPLATLSGEAPPGASVVCSLFGQTTPFDRATVVRLYGDEAGYVAAYERALETAVAGGFVLPEDGDGLARRSRRFRLPAA
ncbi:MAG TPA: alpha/beta hydrolase domain-containing protein [Acidimicrobiales bacterium]|nr:alpha/beta hydrolase domain-containing protein [Acidimicrobiales bacterium]